MKKIRLALALVLLLIALGSLGYSYIERWTFIESLYMTIITMSTVGFHEVRQLSIQGKIFTMCLIISSVGMFAYAITIIGNFLIEGQFSSMARRIKMEKKIELLKNHYLICGFGKVAQEVIKEFRKAKVSFVVISETFEKTPNTSLKMSCLWVLIQPLTKPYKKLMWLMPKVSFPA